MGFNFSIGISFSGKFGNISGAHMMGTSHMPNWRQMLTICDISRKKTCTAEVTSVNARIKTESAAL